ncbi:translation initiation factor eIF-2 beta subunit [Vanrija albida]|uniref:Translation initiation factor eIF-2 beta subunit n=1 Tax=Vanrija albida TaxID=181172 RepID=A0ABR3Q4U4_9TREE
MMLIFLESVFSPTLKMADPEVDLFAGMKKKKKKVAVVDAEDAAPVAAADEAPAAPAKAVEEPVAASSSTPEPAADAAPAEDAGDLFADLKKKKKKKKEIALDLDGAEPEPSADGDVPIVKKKKKKPAADFAKELNELDAERDADADDNFGGDDVFQAGDGESAETGGVDAWVAENRDPTYPELLKRFFTLLHLNNPELAGEKRRYTIVPPQVARDGTKKTMFANFVDICRRMHRQPEHVLAFLYAELGTQGSMDGSQRLILRGRFNQKQIENVLRKYIVEYVTCKICKSPDTLLGKENRLYFLTCESCGSRRSVSAIKAGFLAQVGKRPKAP